MTLAVRAKRSCIVVAATAVIVGDTVTATVAIAAIAARIVLVQGRGLSEEYGT